MCGTHFYKVVRMFLTKKLLALTFVVSALLFTQPANAVTTWVTGVAVDQIGADLDNLPSNFITSNANRPIGDNAIEYFIPLTTADGTYGVDGFGTQQDSGFGGGILSMILAFQPITPNVDGVLEIIFEDLDLIGSRDTGNFLETIEIFNQSGDSLLKTDTTNAIITGDADTQMLSLALGILNDDALANTYYVQLDFSAKLEGWRKGWNTPEYLIASIHQTVPGVPLPAALPLFGTGLAVMGFIGWHRKRKHQ